MAKDKTGEQGNGPINQPRRKKVCPLTKEEFLAAADKVTLTINGTTVTAEVKEFASGSFGWYFNGKVTVKVGDVDVPVQAGCNFTAIGSKDLASASK